MSKGGAGAPNPYPSWVEKGIWGGTRNQIELVSRIGRREFAVPCLLLVVWLDHGRNGLLRWRHTVRGWGFCRDGGIGEACCECRVPYGREGVAVAVLDMKALPWMCLWDTRARSVWGNAFGL